MDNNTFNNNQPSSAPTPAGQPPIPSVPPTPPAPESQPAQPPTPPTPTPIATPNPMNNAMSNPNSSTGKVSFSIKGIVITLASALGIVGFFLPWISALGKSVSGVGVGDEYGYLGCATLMLFTISATISVLNMTHSLSQHYKLAISGINGVAAILSLIITIKLLNEFGQYVGISAGPIVLIIAGVAAAVAPWLPIKED